MIEKVKKLFSKNPFHYAFEGEKLLLQKDYKNALKLYNKAIKYASKDSEHLDLYYSSRAEAKKNLRDLNGALIDITKAIELAPTVYLYYFERSEIKKQLNDKNASEEDLKTVFNILDKNGSSHIFKIYMAERKAAQGNLNEAAELLDGTDDPRYNTENVLNIKVSIHSKMNDKESLINDLNKLIEMFPLRVPYLEHKTNILMDLKRFDEALSVVDKAINLDDKNSKLYVLRIGINFNLKNFEQAQKDINTALNLVISDEDKRRCMFYQSKINEELR